LLRHRGASFSLTEGGSTPHEQKEGDEQVSVSRILADRSNTWFLGGEVDVEKTGALLTQEVISTPAISCGARRARTLRAPIRGEVGRSRASKVRARPTRQLHRVVRRLVTTDCVSKCRLL